MNVKELTGIITVEVRSGPPRRRERLRGNKVSRNEASLNLRETSPLPHEYPTYLGVVILGDVGQQTNLNVSRLLKGCLWYHGLEQVTQFILFPFGIPQRAAWVMQLIAT
jgi:hypothetical protein